MREVTVTDRGGGAWETLTVKDNLIARSLSNHIKGVNKHSGKTYSRFDHQESTIFSWKRADRLRVYRSYKLPRRNGGGRRFQDITAMAIQSPDFWARGDRLDDAFRTLRGSDAATVIRNEYPLAKNCMPTEGVTSHLRHSDATSFTRSLFGEKYARKDLVRSVGGVLEYAHNDTTAAALLAGKTVRGLVPTDWIVDWVPTVARESSVQRVLPRERDLRRLLRSASPKQLRRLVTSDGSLYGITDSVRSFGLIREQVPDYALSDLSFASFKELHDVLSRDQRKLKEPNFDIEYKGKAKKLTGDYEGYRIVAPKSNHDLVDWGTQMSNCIGGYGRAATAGQSLLYGVYEGDSLIANMELDPRGGHIRQLLGKYNAGLKDERAVEAVHAAVKSTWPGANVDGGWQGRGGDW